MAKKRGVFKSEKRKKELLRQKKQEEKRQLRFKKNAAMDDKSDPTLSDEKESND